VTKQPKHRLHREFPEAKRVIIECDLNTCPHCGSVLKARKPWHSRKHVQTLDGPLFVAGRSKECVNPACSHPDEHYYASRLLMISLPYSTYGLDVLAFIGWQHEHEHRQLKEIQGELNRQDIVINERNVGKLYRQFLALLGAADQKTLHQLRATAAKHGGLIWAVDALQPEGNGSLLYVLYEVLSGTPVAAAQLEHAHTDQLAAWLEPYQKLPFTVLATLSDGEEAIIAALKRCWPTAPHQRCQVHFLNNLVEPVLAVDAQLRQALQDDVGGLPAVPEREVEADEPGTDSPFVVC
jgi:Transposase, Mutator family